MARPSTRANWTMALRSRSSRPSVFSTKVAAACCRASSATPAPPSPRSSAGARARRAGWSGFDTGIWRRRGLSTSSQSGRSPSFSTTHSTLLKNGLRCSPAGRLRAWWESTRAWVNNWCSAALRASLRTARREAKSTIRAIGSPLRLTRRCRVAPSRSMPAGAAPSTGVRPRSRSTCGVAPASLPGRPSTRNPASGSQASTWA